MTTNHDLQCQATDREWGDILACRVLPIHPFAGWPWSIGMIPAPNPLDATCILSVEYEHAPKSVITCKASGLEILRPARGFFRSLDGNYLLFNPRLVATVAFASGEPMWRMVEPLTPGGIDKGDVMYRNFRGRDPKVDGLLENRGLK